MDADTWDGRRQAKLAATGVSVHRVRSGGLGGGQHIYVDLDKLHAASEVLEYCKALERTFKVDTFGGNNKLLRLPGTYNHKARALGGRSGAVTWLT